MAAGLDETANRLSYAVGVLEDRPRIGPGPVLACAAFFEEASMKASVSGSLIVACVVSFSLIAVAQESGKKPSAKEHSMTGCVQKGSSADTFVMANTEAKGPKMIGIVESKENLAPHVGHTITITGVDVPAKEVESGKMKVDKADHYMRVSSLKMVSQTCK
jgi:hypothetical protein